MFDLSHRLLLLCTSRIVLLSKKFKVQEHTTIFIIIFISVLFTIRNDTLTSGTLEKGFKCKYTSSALSALQSFRQIFIPFSNIPSMA